VLLEGLNVMLLDGAIITANGGGGGEGAGLPAETTADGADGPQLTAGIAAAGGGGISFTGGDGASGATSDAGAGVAEDGTAGGGGGGGGLGRLRVNGYPQCSRSASAVISAAASRNSCN
jgi:hypothetical protein